MNPKCCKTNSRMSASRAAVFGDQCVDSLPLQRTRVLLRNSCNRLTKGSCIMVQRPMALPCQDGGLTGLTGPLRNRMNYQVEWAVLVWFFISWSPIPGHIIPTSAPCRPILHLTVSTMVPSADLDKSKESRIWDVVFMVVLPYAVYLGT